jgi:hypothetical protein
MSTQRMLTSFVVLVELLIIGPIAYTLVRVERHPLDVSDRLALLSTQVQDRLARVCDGVSPKICKEAEEYVWEWSPTLMFGLKLLVEETECDLQVWSRIVQGFAHYVKPLAKDFSVPLSIESSVVFHANVALLRKDSPTKMNAESVKKSIHKVIDEAEVGGSGDHDERPVNLIAWCLKKNVSTSEFTSYRIPSWGVVSLAEPLEESLGVFQRYAKEVVFGLHDDQIDAELARKRTLGRGLSSVLRKLNATKVLAESMPHLPIVSSVSLPFEEALDLVEHAVNEDQDTNIALQHIRRASVLANAISSDPSLIPQLFVSDENLFAIFAPMIFPTMLPLLIGCMQESKKRILTRRKFAKV